MEIEIFWNLLLYNTKATDGNEANNNNNNSSNYFPIT